MFRLLPCFMGVFLLLSCLFASGQTPQVKGLYVKDIHVWLGDAAEETKLLQYAKDNGFNSLTFFDLHNLNWSAQQMDLLGDFLGRARKSFGVIDAGAAGEKYSFFSQTILNYNNSRVDRDEKFNVMNFEFEFWVKANFQGYYCNNYLIPNGLPCDSSGAFKFAISQFKKIDSLCAMNGLISEIYLGWPEKGQMQSIAAIADRILLHAYRTSDIDVYQYSKNRLSDIATLSRMTTVLPIFSSEPSFMGPWLLSNPIVKPFQTYSNYLANETQSFKNYIDLKGEQWFMYNYMPKPSAYITTNSPLTVCSGQTVTLTANQGASYLWSPGNQTTQSIVVNASGTYSVRVTDVNGFSEVSQPVTVTVNTAQAAAITASGPLGFCTGGSVTLSAPPSTGYVWSNGETTQAITVHNTGYYSVAVDLNGCVVNSPPVFVNVNPQPQQPVISPNGSTNICPGAPVTLTSSVAPGYLWSNGATTRSIVVSAGGNYTVRTYSGPYCFTNSAPQHVTVLPSPPIPSVTLSGSSSLSPSQPNVFLTSSIANAYQWTSGQNTRTINVTSQGTYRVTVTGPNGCKSVSAPVAISANGCTPPPVPLISISGSTTILPGQSVTLTSTPAGGYLWSNGQTTRTITVTQPGTYTVRAYNAGYCFSTSLPVTVYQIAARMSHDMDDLQKSADFNLYPNPATTKTFLRFDSEGELMTLRITDLSGREHVNGPVHTSEGLNELTIDLTGIRPGIYFVELSGMKGKDLRKLIVQ